MLTRRADTGLEPSPKALAVVRTAKKALGIPYVWGGTNYHTGVDCSGLCYVAYHAHGIDLSRTSQEQYKQGTPVSKGRELPGDLVFSYPETGGPGHVVMAIGNGKCIAAPHTGAVVQIEDLHAFDGVYVGTRRIIPAIGQGGSSVQPSGNSDSANSGGSSSLGSAVSAITDTHTYYRIGQVVLGLILLVAGLLVITKINPIGLTPAGKLAGVTSHFKGKPPAPGLTKKSIVTGKQYHNPATEVS